MWKKYAQLSSLALILTGFLFIPLADRRVVENIPLYPLDLILLSVIIFLAGSFWKEVKENSFPKSIVAALVIFFVSSIVSWFVNEPTLTGLGQLKSWFLLPMMAGLVSAFALRRFPERDHTFLTIWLLGLSALLLTLVPYVWLEVATFDGRLEGLFSSPNFLGFFLFPGALLSYYFWAKEDFNSQAFYFPVLASLFLYALFLTHSFSAWLALVVSFFYYFYFVFEKRVKFRKWGLVGLLIAIILLGAELSTSSKLASILESRSSFTSRLTIWTVALETVYQNPILGIGVGRFQEVYLEAQNSYPPFLEWAVPQPHNVFLAVWLQSGIFGLAAFLFLLFKALCVRSGEKPERTVILLRSLLVGMLVYGFFDTPLFGNALAYVWWAVLAFLLFSEKEEKR